MFIKELMNKYKLYDWTINDYLEKESTKSAISAIESLQADQWSDTTVTYKELEKIKIYLYQRYILEYKED